MLPPTDKPFSDNCPVVEIFPCEVIPAAPAEIPPVVVNADVVILPLLFIPAADTVPVVVMPALLTFNPPLPTITLPVPVVLMVPAVILCAEVKFPLRFKLVNPNVPATAKLPPTDTLPLVVKDEAWMLPPTDKPFADN